MTIVELLAALVIGLLVIGAAIATMLLSRSSAAMVTDVARLQQQGSFAMRVIGMQARQAGALDLAESQTPGLMAFNAAFTGFNERGFAVFGLEGANGGPDTISFSSQSAAVAKITAPTQGAEAAAGAVIDLAPRDCLANTAKGSRLDSTFRVEWVGRADNGTLKCTGSSPIPQPIVANVADFQAWYRVKASPAATQRMDADEVEAAKLWGMVSSVEICLDLKGSENTGDQPSRNYVNCQGEAVPHKGVVHMLFRNVFDLRTQGAS